MGIIDRIRGIRERWASGTITRLVETWQEGNPLPQPDDFEAWGRDGYRKCTVIYACVRELATSAAEPFLEVLTGQDPQTGLPQVVEDDPLAQRLQAPNDDQGTYEFLEMLVTHLQVTGNAYVHKVRAAVGRVAALELLRPDRIKIIPAPRGQIRGFVQTINGRAQPELPKDDVIHFKLPDMQDDYYGLSPIAVAAATADLDMQAVDFLRAIFLNRGIPAGILKLQNRVEKTERDRIKNLWLEEYSGFKGWHRLAVLDGGAEYQDVGMRLDELNLDGVFSQTETRLCAVMGVPPIIIALKAGLEHATYSNYEQADRSFWLETLSPMYRRLGDIFTRGLGREYGQPRTVRFNLSKVHALQEDQKAVRQFAIEGWNSGLLKRNEARELVSQPPDPDGDVYKTSGATALPPATSPNGNGQPAAARQGHSFIEGEIVPSPLALPGEAHADAADTPADDPHWKVMHRLADDATPEVQAAFLLAVARTQDAVVQAALEEALAANDFPAAFAAIPWDQVGREVLEETLPPHLRDVFIAAAEASRSALPEAIQLDLKFDLLNPQAVAWVDEHAAVLVREVSEGTKQAIRDILHRSFTEGIPPHTAARQIRQVIGLTRRQAQAVWTYRDRLEADGSLTDAVVDRRVERYYRKMLRFRSETIARTETISAACHGQHRLYITAREQGLLIDATTRRLWIVTPDDRLEPHCAGIPGLNPEGVGLEELFRAPGSVNILHPPLHPRCRCAIVLKFIE